MVVVVVVVVVDGIVIVVCVVCEINRWSGARLDGLIQGFMHI